jgi:hypothetical protein
VLRRILAIAVLTTGTTSTAAAQALDPTGHTSSVFGASRSVEARPFMLDALVTVSGAYDDALSADQLGVSFAESPVGGQYSDVDTTFAFIVTRPRYGINTRVDGGLRLFREANSFVGSNISAGSTLTARLTERTSLRTHVDGHRLSTLAFDTLSRRSAFDGGSPSPLTFRQAAVDWATTSVGAMAELSRVASPRTTFGLSYGTRLSERPLTREQTSEHTVSARLARLVGRNSELVWSYAYRHSNQEITSISLPFWSHEAQVGLERVWRHTASRRTSLTVSGGPAVVDEPSVLVANTRAQLLRIVGATAFGYESVNRWSLRGSFRRGAGVRDSVVFTNTVAVDARAWFGRRVDLTLAGGYSDGDEGTQSFADRIKTQFGSARLRVGLSRLVAIYGQGFLYRYELGTPLPTTTSLPRIDRAGVRVGVSFWGPFL